MRLTHTRSKENYQQRLKHLIRICGSPRRLSVGPSGDEGRALHPTLEVSSRPYATGKTARGWRLRILNSEWLKSYHGVVAVKWWHSPPCSRQQ
jgi:hypothetical protein